MSNIQRHGEKPTYTEIVIHNGTIYLSGQVPWLTAGKAIELQTKEVLNLIDDQLETAGSNRGRILSMQIFLRNPDDYSKMNEVFIDWIHGASAPARNTICGIQFPNSKWDIEVVVIAAT